MTKRTLIWWFPAALVAGVALVEGALHVGAHGAHPAGASAIACGSHELRMDVDGDGVPEHVRLERVGEDAWADVFVSSADGDRLVSSTRVGAWSDDPGSDVVEAVDINGDGKMDLMRRWHHDGRVLAQVWLSDGAAFSPGWEGPIAGVCLAAR